MHFQEIQIVLDMGGAREPVGVLAINDNKVLFEYDPIWIKKGIELSPLNLSTAKATYQFDASKLPGSIPGVFADSLPDGWGMLIMDRFFSKKGINRHEISVIDRLAYLGNNAMGALCYEPSLKVDTKVTESLKIGALAREAHELYEGRIEEAGRLLTKIGGSPGGARPKALIGISDSGTKFVSGIGPLPEGYTQWMVKFSGPAKSTLREMGKIEGLMEYIYLQMAQTAGITVPDFMLIPDEIGLQHIAVRRFDRPTAHERVHVATASGLLHADHKLPSLDYQDLLKFAMWLTRDIKQVKEQFRRAAFNLLAVNRDDHAKNHGYVMDVSGKWQLAPVYDITFSSGPGEEHWTAYLGEGRNPGKKSLLRLAEIVSISEKDAEVIIEEVRSAVEQLPALCKQFEIPPKLSKPIIERLHHTSEKGCFSVSAMP